MSLQTSVFYSTCSIFPNYVLRGHERAKGTFGRDVLAQECVAWRQVFSLGVGQVKEYKEAVLQSQLQEGICILLAPNREMFPLFLK